MIDLTGTDLMTALSPPVPAERRYEGGPAFALLLARGSAAQAGAPMAPPVPEPVAVADAVTMPMPMSMPERAEVPVRRAVVDHAIRFDARGMIAMAAGADSMSSDVPVVARPMSPDARGTATSQAMPPDMVVQPVAATPRALPAMASARPVEHAMPTKPSPLPPAATATAMGEAAPIPTPPDEPEVAAAPAARRRTRFAAMAQGAPQVAVAALSDGLAVSAAMGALSDGERHRMRDAIAATLSRHGLRPRAVTLLALPAPITRMER